jgi:hypothetical protein
MTVRDLIKALLDVGQLDSQILVADPVHPDSDGEPEVSHCNEIDPVVWHQQRTSIRGGTGEWEPRATVIYLYDSREDKS